MKIVFNFLTKKNYFPPQSFFCCGVQLEPQPEHPQDPEEVALLTKRLMTKNAAAATITPTMMISVIFPPVVLDASAASVNYLVVTLKIIVNNFDGENSD